MTKQLKLLNRIAKLLDESKIRTTLNTTPATLNTENIRQAHRQAERGSMIGNCAATGLNYSGEPSDNHP